MYLSVELLVLGFASTFLSTSSLLSRMDDCIQYSEGCFIFVFFPTAGIIQFYSSLPTEEVQVYFIWISWFLMSFPHHDFEAFRLLICIPCHFSCFGAYYLFLVLQGFLCIPLLVLFTYFTLSTLYWTKLILFYVYSVFTYDLFFWSYVFPSSFSISDWLVLTLGLQFI